MRFALSPPDQEHRFGHGKSEGLAALLQSLIIGASGLFVAVAASLRLFNAGPVERPEAGMLVIGLATLITLGLVSWQRYVSRVTGSLAIAADALHYKTDLLVNLSVLLAVAVTAGTGLVWIDPAMGLAVAAYLVFSAGQIGTRALVILLDREIPDADRARIRDLASRHPDVRGFHDLRTRHGGGLHRPVPPGVGPQHVSDGHPPDFGSGGRLDRRRVSPLRNHHPPGSAGLCGAPGSL